MIDLKSTTATIAYLPELDGWFYGGPSVPFNGCEYTLSWFCKTELPLSAFDQRVEMYNGWYRYSKGVGSDVKDRIVGRDWRAVVGEIQALIAPEPIYNPSIVEAIGMRPTPYISTRERKS